MNVQVLVSIMNQTDHSLPAKMNISTDAIIGNQCNYNSIEKFDYNGNTIKYLNFDERGIGLNRNNSLIRADGDILVFADDDETFFDNYGSIIKDAYNKLPKADAIFFNIDYTGSSRKPKNFRKISKMQLFNSLGIATPRITIKNRSVKSNNINFHRQFGGGADYSCGEDSLFIADIFKKGLTIYAYPATISTIERTTSTWFKGYNEKYFYDKGALFAAMFKRFGYILCCLVFLKNRKLLFDGAIGYRRAAKLARCGAKGFYKGITYEKWAMGEKNV